MLTKAIYRLNPTTGEKEYAYQDQGGSYQAVDRRIPYKHGVQTGFRNTARMSVRPATLDELAIVVGLGYAARVRSATATPNYAYPPELVVEADTPS
jgi:hypothetical protein